MSPHAQDHPRPTHKDLEEAEEAVRVGRTVHARNLLTGVLADPPRDLASRQLLVLLLIACSSFREALPVLESTLTWYPGDQRSLLQRAECRAKLGDLHGALHDAEDVIRFSGESTEALRMLYRCQVRRNEWAAALEVVRKLTDREPEEFELWLERGLYACDVGDLQEAEVSWRQADAIAPSRWEPAHNLALLALLRKDRNAAISHLLRCIETAPKVAEPRATLASIVWEELGPLSRHHHILELLLGNPGLPSHRWERLNRFTPDVIELFHRERRRVRRSWFTMIGFVLCTLTVPLGAFVWTYRLFTAGIGGARLNSGWLVLYVLLLLLCRPVIGLLRDLVRTSRQKPDHSLPSIPDTPS